MNFVKFCGAPFYRIILSIIPILSSIIVTAAPKHFVLPSWVTVLPYGEYLGVPGPEESQEIDIQSDILSYYAGYGIPNEKTRDAFLLLVDGYGTNPLTGFSKNRLYSNLEKNPTKRTLVLLDACFSGTVRRDGMLENASSVAINVKNHMVGDNMIVFCASQENQTMWPYPEKSHGMFTYHLLEKIRDSEGKATIGELTDYVTEYFQTFNYLQLQISDSSCSNIFTFLAEPADSAGITLA